MAKTVLRPNFLTTQCGTPNYVAPEILKGLSYDTSCDLWSLGVILYILLSGYPPFIDKEQRILFYRIRHGQYEFHEQYWNSVSNEAQSLIRNLLVVEPAERYTAAQALAETEWVMSPTLPACACSEESATKCSDRKEEAKEANGDSTSESPRPRLETGATASNTDSSATPQ
jgi:serine/threonine protein kinase